MVTPKLKSGFASYLHGCAMSGLAGGGELWVCLCSSDLDAEERTLAEFCLLASLAVYRQLVDEISDKSFEKTYHTHFYKQ